MTRTALAGSATAARHAGMPVDEINQILGAYGLNWDEVTGLVFERHDARAVH